MKRCLRTICFATLMASGAVAQQKKSVPPPPKPQDAGPSLEVTMKFIQDKMNDHGTVGYVYTRNNMNGALFRTYTLMSEVEADVSTCTLRAKKKGTAQIEVAEGNAFYEGGKAISGDDLHREMVYTSASPLKDVVSIAVESAQDHDNRVAAEEAHPEITSSYTPAVYYLFVKGAKKDAFSFHSTFNKGKERPREKDFTDDTAWFMFRDEETANRVAKAMLHAVELCGGGNKDPF
jgi:hypothetical protein